MHSAWVRANAAFTFSATILAGLCVLATVSGMLKRASVMGLHHVLTLSLWMLTRYCALRATQTRSDRQTLSWRLESSRLKACKRSARTTQYIMGTPARPNSMIEWVLWIRSRRRVFCCAAGC